MFVTVCMPVCLSVCLPLFLYVRPGCLSVCPSVCLTCLGVDGEEVLWVAGSDAVTEATGRGSQIGVLRLDTDHRHVLGRVLHDNRVVDRIGGQGGIVVHILHLRGREKRTKV